MGMKELVREHCLAEKARLLFDGCLIIGLSWWGFFIGSCGESYSYLVMPLAFFVCIIVLVRPFDRERHKKAAERREEESSES